MNTLSHTVFAGLLALGAMLAPATAAAQSTTPIDGIVAIVDEDVILRSELDRAVNNIVAQYASQPGQLPPRDVLERQVLDRLVVMRLQLARANESGVRVSDGETNRQFAAGAQTANAVNVFVDSVSLKNDVLNGGVIGQDASRGNPFPQNAVQEFRVLTQNYSAEFQKSSSAVITAITKSGTNDFSGEVFGYYQDKDFVDRDPCQRSVGVLAGQVPSFRLESIKTSKRCSRGNISICA